VDRLREDKVKRTLSASRISRGMKTTPSIVNVDRLTP